MNGNLLCESVWLGQNACTDGIVRLSRSPLRLQVILARRTFLHCPLSHSYLGLSVEDIFLDPCSTVSPSLIVFCAPIIND